MKQWKHLDEGMKIILYRYRQKNLEEFFTMEGTLVACKNVDGLFTAINMSHCLDEWRLFIDSSKVIPKAVLLHNGNVLPSSPVAHAFGIKESDDSVKQILQYVKYDMYKSNIVIALLLGVQLGYSKFPRFLCEWDSSRDKAHHYVKRIWPARKILEPGHKNVKHHSLVESSRNLLPPLLIKLSLMKNFVNAMDHNGTAFLYLQKKFPLLSDAKIWEGIFTSPDIHSLLRDEVFERIITGNEQRAWHAFFFFFCSFFSSSSSSSSFPSPPLPPPPPFPSTPSSSSSFFFFFLFLFFFSSSFPSPLPPPPPSSTTSPSSSSSFFFFFFLLFFFFFFYFFFFLGPVSLCTECTAALGLLCSPNISFSTASITLRLV